MPFSAYIICATPRCGSTLLCDLLAASGVAGRPQSYFRHQDIGYWAALWGVQGSISAVDPEFNRAYLAAMARAGAADTGVFGLRLMWQSVGETAERLNAAFGGDAVVPWRFEQAFGRTLFIYLSRQDKVAQAVSFVRAEQTGLWHVAADGSERQRTAPPRAPVFDSEHITKACDILANDDKEWSSFFDQHGITPVRLSYEGLTADPQSAAANILATLGRDPINAAHVKAMTAKMADAISAEWVERMKPK